MRFDRNARARLMTYAEALDRRTRLPGQHGGILKRTGLAVLKALLFGFANVTTARCDPSFDTLARASGCCRATVAVALGRLEAAGLLERVRRQVGLVRYSNAYVFPPAQAASAALNSSETGKSSNRAETTTNPKILPFSANSMPSAGGGLPMAVALARVRDALRGDYEAIVRNRQRRAAATSS